MDEGKMQTTTRTTGDRKYATDRYVTEDGVHVMVSDEYCVPGEVFWSARTEKFDPWPKRLGRLIAVTGTATSWDEAHDEAKAAVERVRRMEQTK